MKIAIVTFGDRKVNAWKRISWPIMKKYCAIHNYAFINSEKKVSGRPAAWTKIRLLLDNLEHFDWLLWIDVDCAIEQPHLKLESFIDNDKSLIFCNGGIPATLNSGVFFVKNNAWAKEFLQTVYNQEFLINNALLLPKSYSDYKKRKSCVCDGCKYFRYEQKSFIHTIFTMQQEDVEKNIEIRTPKNRKLFFQSYDENYWAGCFIHHFPGFSEDKKYTVFLQSARVTAKKLQLLEELTQQQKLSEIIIEYQMAISEIEKDLDKLSMSELLSTIWYRILNISKPRIRLKKIISKLLGRTSPPK